MITRVAIAEDDAEIRRWLKNSIESDDDLVCTSEFSSGAAFMNALDSLNADVVLVDINMPGGINGVQCVKEGKLRYPGIHFIMCTIFEDTDNIFNSLCAGATGYILKNATSEKITESIREVVNGGSPMSATIARKVVSSFLPQGPRSNAAGLLSKREIEILEHLSKGFRYKEIADKLFISTETVRTHIRNIYEKLQVKSRTEALNKVFFRH